MMQSSFSTIGPVFALFGLIHVLAALSFLVGIALLLMWAFKHLSPAQLKKWGLILLICGGVVSLVTMLSFSQGGFPHRGFYRVNGGGAMMRDVPNGMMQQDENGNWIFNGGGMMRDGDEGSSSSAS